MSKLPWQISTVLATVVVAGGCGLDSNDASVSAGSGGSSAHAENSAQGGTEQWEGGGVASGGANASVGSAGTRSTIGNAGDDWSAGNSAGGAVRLLPTDSAGTTGFGGAGENADMPSSAGAPDQVDYAGAAGETAATGSDCANFSRQFGDTEQHSQPAWAQGVAIARDVMDNVFVAGYHSQAIEFNALKFTEDQDDIDPFIAKLDSCGRVLWGKGQGDASSQTAQGVAITPDGSVVVAGSFQGLMNFGGPSLTGSANSTAFVTELDGAGATRWATQLDGTGQSYGGPIAAAADGSVYLAGSFTGTLNIGADSIPASGSGSGFLVKLDAAGHPIWSRGFQALGEVLTSPAIHIFWNLSAAIGAVALDTNGDILVSGGTSASAGPQVDVASSLRIGSEVVTIPSRGAAFVAKLDSQGTLLWIKSFEGVSWLTPVFGNEHRIFLWGGYTGTIDIGGGPVVGSGDTYSGVLAGFDSSGGYLWSHTFGDASDVNTVVGEGIAVDGSGNVLIGGSLTGSVDFGGGPLQALDTDVLLAKFDAGGHHLLSSNWGGQGDQIGHGLASSIDSSALLTGAFTGQLKFSNTLLDTPSGDGFLFVAKVPVDD